MGAALNQALEDVIALGPLPDFEAAGQRRRAKSSWSEQETLPDSAVTKTVRARPKALA